MESEGKKVQPFAVPVGIKDPLGVAIGLLLKIQASVEATAYLICETKARLETDGDPDAQAYREAFMRWEKLREDFMLTHLFDFQEGNPVEPKKDT